VKLTKRMAKLELDINLLNYNATTF